MVRLDLTIERELEDGSIVMLEGTGEYDGRDYLLYFDTPLTDSEEAYLLDELQHGVCDREYDRADRLRDERIERAMWEAKARKENQQ